MTKDTVEDYLDVNVSWLNKHDYFIGYKSGSIKWSWGSSGRESSISLTIDVTNYWYPENDNQPHASFQYTTTDRDNGEKNDYDYKVGLVHTKCHLGGKRWWFICPLITDGRACRRRVGVLYKGSRYFGCRHCLNLTYKKCQESSRYRYLGQMMDYEEKAEKLFEGMKRRREYYRGKPTHRYQKYLKYSSRGAQVASNWLAIEKALYKK